MRGVGIGVLAAVIGLVSWALLTAGAPASTPRAHTPVRRTTPVAHAAPAKPAQPPSRVATTSPATTAAPQAPPRQPPAASPPPTPVTLQPGTAASVQTLVSGGLARSYLLVQPAAKPAGKLPAVVVLHGSAVTPELEERRTGFFPLAQEGKAVLAYPAGVGKTWNAGQGCCGEAVAKGLNDSAFVQAVAAALVARDGVDPHRIYLVGYSNGGKLAQRIACTDPGPFAAVATYGAVPLVPCGSGPPVPVMLAAATGDTEVPYSGRPETFAGALEPPVSAAVATWRLRDRCRSLPTSRVLAGGAVTVTTWAAGGGPGGSDPVELVTYEGGSHYWPGAPSAAGIPFSTVSPVPVESLMWSFLAATHG